MKWAAYPFVRYLFFLVSGILFSVKFDPPENVMLLLLIVVATIYTILFFSIREGLKLYYIKPLKGLLAFCFIFLTGINMGLLHTDTKNPNHFTHYKGKFDFYKANIVSFEGHSGNYLKYEAEVKAIKDTIGRWQAKEGKILLYIKDMHFPYKEGDLLLIKGAPFVVMPPLNPTSFNYKDFLKWKNIYHNHYIHSGKHIYLCHENHFSLLAKAQQARSFLAAILQTSIKGKQELQVLSALLLGDKKSLDRELKSIYSGTGAMHILAVSGLHVGIIFQTLLILLTALKNLKNGKIICNLLAILLLWVYAFVTGLSPSVLRAVCMFSIVLLAKSIRKEGNIYNSIALAAFVLLLYKPFWIFDPGFLLSFSAVCGIVFIYPAFNQIYNPKNVVLKYASEIIFVSIAAQIATLPLTIYYFNQFPTYFLFTNLLAIPLAFLVVYTGILFFVVSGIPYISNALAIVLEQLTFLLNKILFKIDNTAFSSITNIRLGLMETFLLVFIIIATIIWFSRRNIFFAYSVALLCLLLTCHKCFLHLKYSKQKKIVVYNIPNHTAISLVNGRESILLTDSILANNNNKIDFHIKPFQNFIYSTFTTHTLSGKTPVPAYFSNEIDILVWEKTSIAIVKDIPSLSLKNQTFDYVVLTGKSLHDPAKTLKYLQFKHIIISNPLPKTIDLSKAEAFKGLHLLFGFTEIDIK